MSTHAITTTRRPGVSQGCCRVASAPRCSRHVITAAGLLGADVAALPRDTSGWRDADPVRVYPAISLLVRWLLIPLAILSLLAGVALRMLTSWRLLRRWWVVINTVGLALAVVGLLPLGQRRHQPLGAQSLDGEGHAVRNSSGAWVALVLSVLLA